MKKIDFDNYASNYNALLREGTGFFSEDETYFARYKVDLARRLITHTPARVLEFGCGIGRNIRFLREAFPQAEIMGSDPSVKSIEVARAENPDVHFWVEDGTDSPGEFDLIFVAGVFHHIPPSERPAAAALLADRLSPRGEVLVFEHNPYNPVTRKIVRDCPYDEGVLLLKPLELRAHLAEAGLGRAEHGYSLFFPPRLGRMASLERWLAWLPLGGQYWMRASAA